MSDTPSAHWTEERAKQALEEARESGYDGNYRGVPVVHGGPQSVRPSQTTGAYDLCWCGEPVDHDWPGKDRGRKHPRTTTATTRKVEPEMSSTPAEAPHIERKHLRTFHEGLVDVILRAVNDYHVRYRLSGNGCILYPPDGSQPYTIYARNTERQVRASRKWFVEHVLGTEGAEALVKNQDRLLDDMDIREQARRLAEAVNGPEHDVPAPEEPKETSVQRRARKAQERQEAAEQLAAAEAARKAAEQEAAAAAELEAEAAQKAADEEAEAAAAALSLSPEPEEEEEVGHIEVHEVRAVEQERTTPQIHVRENGDPADEGEWVPWRNRHGVINEHYETDGNIIKCRECDFTTTKGQGVSGHYLTNHNTEHRARMYGADAQQKKATTKRDQKIAKNVGEAIDLLYKALGKDNPADDKTVKARIRELETATITAQETAAKAQFERDEAIEERDTAVKALADSQARLDLLREALQA